MASKTYKQLKKKRNALNNYGSYSYNDNGLYGAYQNAQSVYDDMLAHPEKYGFNDNSAEVDALFQQIMNPEQFSYDMSKDKLFQMYKKQYNAQGTRAMQNAMGAGVALSGGYNSSAAQTGAQTTYLGYLDALNDKAAETYANALSRYEKKQSDLMNRYNVAKDMNDSARNAYYTQLGVASQNLSNAQNAYMADDDRQYRSWQDNRSFLQTQVNDLQQQYNSERNFKLQKKLYKGR